MTRAQQQQLTAVALVLAGMALVYWPVITGLVSAWNTDDNYSHGFFIVPLALYFAWERRRAIADAPVRPSWLGLVVMIGSLVMLAGGLLGAELFLSRVSIVFALAGAILFLFGWPRLRILAFPLAFMLLMVPLPAIIFNKIAFPLQLIASHVGEYTISSMNIPILREGNVLILANATLEVAEACSGIRSLVSLFTLGIVFGYFVDRRLWVRSLIALSAIPVAILANGLRVASAGVAAHNYGLAGVEGIFHDFSGWVVFVVAFLMMLGFQRLLQRLLPERLTAPRVPTPETAI
ncbi:MAG TPA: exosortase A [Vicinamibacterales bacterium]|nr:exosortase A [Vicinamibacterales bacterium]